MECYLPCNVAPTGPGRNARTQRAVSVGGSGVGNLEPAVGRALRRGGLNFTDLCAQEGAALVDSVYQVQIINPN